MECLSQTIGAVITKRDMYNYYTKWAEIKGYAVETIKMFGRYIKTYAPFMIEKQITHGSIRVWLNVSTR